MTNADYTNLMDGLRRIEANTKKLNAASLTKREYFAAMAMQALATGTPISSLTDFADIASDAVQFANALIEALNEETK